MGKCYYCPICGVTFMDKREECNYCGSKMYFFESKHDLEYYKSRARKAYNDQIHWRRVLTEEEITRNPLFEIEKYNFSHSKEGRDNAVKRFNDKFREEEKREEAQKNIPRCPTCNSENIKKISGMRRAFHGYAFGIFSKTAFSQFECQNCGYKW